MIHLSVYILRNIQDADFSNKSEKGLKYLRAYFKGPGYDEVSVIHEQKAVGKYFQGLNITVVFAEGLKIFFLFRRDVINSTR